MQPYLAFAMKLEDPTTHRPPTTRPCRQVAFGPFSKPNATSHCQQAGTYSDNFAFCFSIQADCSRVPRRVGNVNYQATCFSENLCWPRRDFIVADECGPQPGPSLTRLRVAKDHSLRPANETSQGALHASFPTRARPRSQSGTSGRTFGDGRMSLTSPNFPRGKPHE